MWILLEVRVVLPFGVIMMRFRCNVVRLPIEIDGVVIASSFSVSKSTESHGRFRSLN